MDYIFRNFVFEGGGVKGLAYVGALQVLEEKGIQQNITRVAGASAGAICALLVGLNYNSEEIKDILWHMDFRDFMDKSKGILRNTYRLLNHFGWYKGDFFKHWIEGIIEKKTGQKNITFKELHHMKDFKDMVFIGTNLSTHFSELFSFRTTPDMDVAEALRITMSIPLFFQSVKANHDQIYVDGGLLMNYPIKVFDRKLYVESNSIRKEYYKHLNDKITSPDMAYVYNKETLGFRLDSEKDIEIFQDEASPSIHQIKNFPDYVWNVSKTLLDAQLNSHLHSDDWHRTVYIDSLGIKTTDFDLTDEQKKALVQSGVDHTKAYFEWFDDEDSSPLNK